MNQRVLLVRHAKRQGIFEAADVTRRELESRGISVCTEEEVSPDEHFDLVIALGGDGTLLAAAAHARCNDAPLMGINMGHMGFLTEATVRGIPTIARRIAEGNFTVDTRMTLDVTVRFPDGTTVSDWALNEAVILHTDPAHPVDLALVVDGQDVSTYAADGIILSTPTGSTAYSFSAGGPVVWPDVEAIVMAPLAAHGLFTRPMVVGSSTVVEVDVLANSSAPAEMWCDGLRQIAIPSGSSIVATIGFKPVRLARLDNTSFATRIVEKFELPIRGWRE